MAAPSTGVTWVNSGLAVLDEQNADAPVPPRADIEALRDERAQGAAS